MSPPDLFCYCSDVSNLRRSPSTAPDTTSMFDVEFISGMVASFYALQMSNDEPGLKALEK